MLSQSWKDHERKVASYFNTTRRARGGDFSQSDIEVLATSQEWLGDKKNRFYLTVECKYSSGHGIIYKFNKLKKKLGYDKFFGTFLVAQISDLYLMELQHFECFFLNYKSSDAYYEIAKLDYLKPEYLDEYLEQSTSYISKIPKLDKPVLPLACITKKAIKGKLIVVNIDTLNSFMNKLNSKS